MMGFGKAAEKEVYHGARVCRDTSSAVDFLPRTSGELSLSRKIY